MKNKFINAHHSPVGSFSSFTLGFKGANGGFGNMLGTPANQNLYIGFGDGVNYDLLPFYDPTVSVDTSHFASEAHFEGGANINMIDDERIEREFNLGTDTFKVEDFKLTIYTPNFSVPETKGEEQKVAITPSLIAEIELVNNSDQPKEIVFGFLQNMKDTSLVHGIETKSIFEAQQYGISTNDEDTRSVVQFNIQDVLEPSWKGNEFNAKYALGETGALITTVAPNSTKKVTYALSFFRDGVITSGIKTKFKYTDYFEDINEVAEFALANSNKFIDESIKINTELDSQSTLTDEEKFQIAHAEKAYYGSTQFLVDKDGKDYFNVNEGEYRMMQTFDLMIDHLFYELYKNPWVIKNNLQLFMDRYSYEDQVKDKDGNLYPGGISFAHDMGVTNNFSPEGRSAYELQELDGCWSHMTYEQLTNFTITILTYANKTGDIEFLNQNKAILDKVVTSLLNRDHYDDSQRNGIMSLDSSRTGVKGMEITTYDSLDKSLGQSRENSYIASKTYTSYALLKDYYESINENEKVDILEKQIQRLIKTIAESNIDGLIPAVLDSEEGKKAKIIPVAEGLSYLIYLGKDKYLDEQGEYGEYIKLLREHTNKVLEEGICLYPNGGYKLSSTADNTWLSKVYLSIYVHRELFNIDEQLIQRAQKAHVDWLVDKEGSYWSWSDQIIKQVITGSKFYPRGVTSALWRK